MKAGPDSEYVLVDGWLKAAEKRPSPNCSGRPALLAISSIIIHNISLPPGEYGSGHIIDLFTNCLDPEAHPYFADVAHLQVSAHFLIRRDGSILQFVSTCDKAWHAGISSWGGLREFNDFSIGIELEGSDFEPFTDKQYSALNSLIISLRQSHTAIRPELILGHSDIAPGRKTDPGPFFDWTRLQKSTLQV